MNERTITAVKDAPVSCLPTKLYDVDELLGERGPDVREKVEGRYAELFLAYNRQLRLRAVLDEVRSLPIRGVSYKHRREVKRIRKEGIRKAYAAGRRDAVTVDQLTEKASAHA